MVRFSNEEMWTRYNKRNPVKPQAAVNPWVEAAEQKRECGNAPQGRPAASSGDPLYDSMPQPPLRLPTEGEPSLLPGAQRLPRRTSPPPQ